MIELLFKQIKQSFPLQYFWSESENVVKIQVYMVLIAQLLMAVLRKKSQPKKSFVYVTTTIRLHLVNHANIYEFIQNARKAWTKAHPPSDIFNTA